jgi:PTS system mannose-specific IIA component
VAQGDAKKDAIMTGIVIVTHSQLGDALIDASEFILGSRPEAVVAVSIDLKESAEKLRKKIADGIKTVNQKQGVLILTDMFGGTPSNISLSFLQKDRVEVLTGVNLPMIIFIHQNRNGMSLTELAEKTQDAGKAGISLAGKLLEGE